MGCEAINKELMAKIETVVKARYPHAIDNPGFVSFAETHHPELKQKHDTLYAEANKLWLNCQDNEFKKISTEWGRVVLDMYKLFDAHLRAEREAA